MSVTHRTSSHLGRAGSEVALNSQRAQVHHLRNKIKQQRALAAIFSAATGASTGGKRYCTAVHHSKCTGWTDRLVRTLCCDSQADRLPSSIVRTGARTLWTQEGEHLPIFRSDPLPCNPECAAACSWHHETIMPTRTCRQSGLRCRSAQGFCEPQLGYDRRGEIGRAVSPASVTSVSG